MCFVGVCVCLATICVCVLKFHTFGGGRGGERPAQGAGALLVAKGMPTCALQQVCEHTQLLERGQTGVATWDGQADGHSWKIDPVPMWQGKSWTRGSLVEEHTEPDELLAWGNINGKFLIPC